MGKDPDQNPILRRLDTEPSFRSVCLAALKSLIRTDGAGRELDRIIKEAVSKR